MKGLLGAAAVSVLASASLLLLASSGARALTPPPLEEAQIVYSNGGRIISMQADGSDRQVLTRPGKVIRSDLEGRRGDRLPKVSPDGTQMLFFRETDDAPFDSAFSTRGKQMLANVDGSGARQILKPKTGITYREASWMPDGSIVAAKRVYRGKKFGYRRESSVVTMNLDGSNERTVFKLRYHLQGNLKDDLSSYFLPIELAPSPDGQSLLVTIQNGYRNDGRRLEVVSIADGSRTVIAKKSYSGGWSPDGQSIVFASDRDKNGKVCPIDDGCRTAGDIFIADADGDNQRPLLSTRAEEANPAWSPDGESILFSGTRNKPRQEFAAEIYSVRPDGSCLTWLTNGSPASITPAWAPGSSSDPGACGAIERPALVEGIPVRTRYASSPPPLWFGPSLNGMLYSGLSGILDFSFVEYQDCSTFDPSQCGRGATITSIGTCELRGALAMVLQNGRREGRALWGRGVRVIQSREDGAAFTLVFSGGAITLPGDILGGLAGNRNSRGMAGQLRLFEKLRPVGEIEAGGDLPPMLIPKATARKARKVTRAFRRTGSVKAAAKRLEMGRKNVRANLAFKRNARFYGGGRQMNCPGRTGFPVGSPQVRSSESGSGSDSGSSRSLLPLSLG